MLIAAPLLAVIDWLHRLPEALSRTAILLGAGVGFLVGVRFLWRERRTAQKTWVESLSLYRQDLSIGQVDVLHCTIADAVELADIEEAPGYFLDVGDGRLLFLNGQYLQWLGETDQEQDDDEDEESAPCFPCRAFDVVQAIHSKQVLDVQCLGPVLTPSRILDPEEDDLGDIYFPHDGELLTAALSTLVEDLKRLNASKPRP